MALLIRYACSMSNPANIPGVTIAVEHEPEMLDGGLIISLLTKNLKIRSVQVL